MSADFRMGKYLLRCTGSLKDFSLLKNLSEIRAPTLVYNGHYDQCPDFVSEPFVQLIPGAKRAAFDKSSHMPQFEEKEKCIQVVGDFLLS